jgi:hypothetical protein
MEEIFLFLIALETIQGRAFPEDDATILEKIDFPGVFALEESPVAADAI